MPTPRVRLPDTATTGQEIEVRTLINHPMITAVSSDDPRDMLAGFTATLNGDTVFSYDFGNGSAENPTFTFYVRAAAPGDFSFVWTHEDGTVYRLDQSVSIT